MSLLDTASLIVTPNGYKEGKLYSVIPSDGSGDMSVTRATTATRVNSAGLVELVPYNLLGYSEDFTNASWLKGASTITGNTTTAPNGTLTADTFTGNGASDLHIVLWQTDIIGVGNTISVYAKKNTNDFLQIYTDFVNTDFANFNLANGTTGSVGSSVISSSIESVGDGWYRCSFVVGSASSKFVNFCLVTSSTAGRAETNSLSTSVFLWGAQLNEGTIKPYQKTETRLNIPRLDYSNGTCPSLLVEPQRTNLLTYSSSFDNGVWNKSNTTISANSAISPSGINDADSLVPNTTNAAHFIENSNYLNLSIGQTYTTSFYAKANGYNFIQFTADGGDISGNPRANFNLSNGTLGSVDAGITASIQDIGNGWYRCVATYVAAYNVFNNIICVINSSTAARAEAFIGNGTDGILIYGAQTELGSYPTSYIPTTSASVTRNADVISKTGIGSIFGTSYTIFGDVVNQNVNNTRLLTLKIPSAGLYDNFITIYQNGTALTATGNNASSAEQFTITSGGYSLNQRLKFALRCENNNVAFYINGTQIGVDTSCTIPQVTALYLGNYVDVFGVSVVNSAAAWPTALTNTQLAQLTTI
jgi:hypothetical protein